MAGGRDLGLTGLHNARDLGGYPTADARTVRPGLLLRSGALGSATPEDVAALQALGVGVVIDLRGDSEIALFGQGPWTGTRAHLPITDLTQALFSRMVDGGSDGEPLAEDEVVKVMIEMYRQFVADESCRAAFASALALIAEQATQGTPILFHCTAGKDRTGWLSALVLSALGTDRETVIADYLLTGERAAQGRGAVARAKLVATVRGMVGERQPIEPLLDVRREYLQAAFDEAETMYGSVEALLREGLGVDADRFRATLLD
jgi:protein-tyrosine phosphatase